jgi:hypothetical protein
MPCAAANGLLPGRGIPGVGATGAAGVAGSAGAASAGFASSTVSSLAAAVLIVAACHSTKKTEKELNLYIASNRNDLFK